MWRSVWIGVLVGFGLGCEDVDAPTPDGAWDVTVTGVSSDCTQDSTGYRGFFEYQIFSNGADIELRIAQDDGSTEGFAIGVRSGCAVQYQSAVWLEEQEVGDLRWQITGEATYQGLAGGCDLTEGLDWEGTEIIEVVESLDENTPEGCTYLMSTEGVYIP